MTDKIPAKVSGGRPATGSIVWEDPETKTRPRGVRVTRADGSRRVIRFDIGTTPEALNGGRYQNPSAQHCCIRFIGRYIILNRYNTCINCV